MSLCYFILLLNQKVKRDNLLLPVEEHKKALFMVLVGLERELDKEVGMGVDVGMDKNAGLDEDMELAWLMETEYLTRQSSMV